MNNIFPLYWNGLAYKGEWVNLLQNFYLSLINSSKLLRYAELFFNDKHSSLLSQWDGGHRKVHKTGYNVDVNINSAFES